MKSIRKTTGLSVGLILMALAGIASCTPSADEIVVYSSRKEHLIKPLFDRYTEATGIPIRYVTGEAGPLMQRLIAEGENTPADLLITVDAGNLWFAAQNDLLQSVESTNLNSTVPAHLRDPGNRWFGLSVRARTIVYSTERVTPDSLTTYEALANPEWHGRLCLRTAKKVYNQSLVAMLIAQQGESKTEQIVKGWIDNLATGVFSNDTKVMEAILAGQCDVGIVNSYYFGRMQKDRPDVNLRLFWPDQDGHGVHVNVSGAGVTKNAKHAGAAIELLEWLASKEAQGMFAGLNQEYPANTHVAVDPQVAAWGTFKPNPINVARAGELQADAMRLMDRAGYN